MNYQPAAATAAHKKQLRAKRYLAFLSRLRAFPASACMFHGFKTPPVLGGKIELSNVETVPLEVHISLMGQIHQQVKNHPPGTKIKGFQIA